MSGPAGGVTGALWAAKNAGYENILTLDMGGTSTDVSLIENGAPRLTRDTEVGDLTVRTSSLDVKTVGAGGGSIAHVPEIDPSAYGLGRKVRAQIRGQPVTETAAKRQL